VAEPRRLSLRIQRELHDPGNELWLSPISVWEALLLHAKGRIQIATDVREWTDHAIANLHEAPLTYEIAIAAHNLALADRDPADRFLAATAEVLGLTLVTADVKLLGLGTIATLANR